MGLVSVRDVQSEVRIFDCRKSLQVVEQLGCCWWHHRLFENCSDLALEACFALASLDSREFGGGAWSRLSWATGLRCQQIGGVWVHYQVRIQRLQLFPVVLGLAQRRRAHLKQMLWTREVRTSERMTSSYC